MKPFVVEFRIRAVVMGEDESDAYCNAMNNWREIASDSPAIIDVEREVFSAKDLPSEWDLQCIPYGGDGNTRLEALLGEQQ
jgi:hypothetical protein